MRSGEAERSEAWLGRHAPQRAMSLGPGSGPPCSNLKANHCASNKEIPRIAYSRALNGKVSGGGGEQRLPTYIRDHDCWGDAKRPRLCKRDKMGATNYIQSEAAMQQKDGDTPGAEPGDQRCAVSGGNGVRWHLRPPHNYERLG